MRSSYLAVKAAQFVDSWFELILPKDFTFRFIPLAYGLLNLFVAMFIEYYVIEYLVFIKLRKRLHNDKKSHRKFLIFEKEMANNHYWPTLSQESLPEATPDILIRQIQVCESIKIFYEFFDL